MSYIVRSGDINMILSLRNAIIIPTRLIPRDVEVFQVRVRDPESILAPVVTEGFQVAKLVMLTVIFEMEDGGHGWAN